MADQMESAIKVTLSSGKVILLRQLKIKHQTLAAQAVGKRAGDNTMAMAMMMQQELVKMLLVKINDRVISASEREDLDALFSFAEYQQVQNVVGRLMGGEDVGEAKTEIVATGTP